MARKGLKLIISLMAVCTTAFALNINTAHAAGEYATISGGGTINTDGSVTVSVNISNNDGLWGTQGTLSYDAGVIEYVSGSGATVKGGGGQISFVQDYDGAATSKSVSVTFKAVGLGNTSVSLASCSVMGQDANPVNCAGGSAAVTVASSSGGQESGGNNAANNNAGANATEKTGSSDSSLSSLAISPGTLTPAFKSGTYNYTTQVEKDITAITVSATPKDSKASVVSVNGAKSIKPGENTVTVVVEAENGSRSTYSIKVLCGEKESEEDGNIVEVPVTVNGNEYTIAKVIPNKEIPTDFEESSIDYQGQKIKVLKYTKGNINLVYLVNNTDKSSALYVYDDTSGTFYPFIKIAFSENKYIILLIPSAGTAIPEGYVQTSYIVNNKDFTAYQKSNTNATTNGTTNENNATEAVKKAEDGKTTGSATVLDRIYSFFTQPYVVQAAETNKENAAGDTAQESNTQNTSAVSQDDFFLVYAMNSDGNQGWYQYDTADNTYQRYTVDSLEDNTTAQLKADISALQGKYDKDISTLRMILYIVAGVAIVILIITIVVLIKTRKNNDYYNDDEDFDDEEDSDDEDEEDISSLEKQLSSKNLDKSEDDNEDEDFDLKDKIMKSLLFEEENDKEDVKEDKKYISPMEKRLSFNEDKRQKEESTEPKKQSASIKCDEPKENSSKEEDDYDYELDDDDFEIFTLDDDDDK